MDFSLEQKVHSLESELKQQELIGCDLNTRLRLESGRCEEATDKLNELSRELNKLKKEHSGVVADQGRNQAELTLQSGDPNSTYRIGKVKTHWLFSKFENLNTTNLCYEIIL